MKSLLLGSFLFLTLTSSLAQKKCYSGDNLLYSLPITGNVKTLDFKESWIIKNDTNTIHAFENVKTTDAIVVIYFHGNGDNLWSKGLQKKLNLINDKFGLIAIDYPGYGKSKGAQTIHNILSIGVETYAYVKRKYPNKQIIVWGHSLGTILAIDLAKSYHFNKLICEGTISNIHLMKEGLEKLYSKISGVNITLTMCKEEKFDNFESAKSIKNNVLFIHGDADEFTSIELINKMISSIPITEKKLITLKNVGHNYSAKKLNSIIKEL